MKNPFLPLLQHLPHIHPRPRPRRRRDLLGRTLGNDAAAAVAALGAHVDDVIGAFDHVEVMFDDDDGVATLGQLLEDVHQLMDIEKV